MTKHPISKALPLIWMKSLKFWILRLKVLTKKSEDLKTKWMNAYVRAICLYGRLDYYTAIFSLVAQRISATKEETTTVSDQLYQKHRESKESKQ